MGGLRKHICCLMLGLPLLAAPPALFAENRPDPLPLFATCTGRLSALVEHQWLIQDPAADETEARRDQMASLLEAVTGEDMAVKAMDLRLKAKVAAAQLLAEARFGQNRLRAEWAGQRADQLVSACTALLIS